MWPKATLFLFFLSRLVAAPGDFHAAHTHRAPTKHMPPPGGRGRGRGSAPGRPHSAVAGAADKTAKPASKRVRDLKRLLAKVCVCVCV